MKFSIFILILFLNFIPQAYSQIWEEVSTPFDYERVNSLNSINNEIYVSKYDWDSEYVFNYQYSNNQWIKAKDDSIYKEFKIIESTDQFNNRILVSCLGGVYLSEDSAESWVKIRNKAFRGDCDISPNGIFAIEKSFEEYLLRYDEISKEWERLDVDKQDTLQYFFVKQIESNKTHLFALQQRVANPFKYKDTLSGGLFISLDKGDSWEKTLSDSLLSTVFVTDVYVLVSTKFGNLLRSEDNGKTWSVIEIGSEINHFTLDGDRIIGNSNPMGVMESRDNGKSWQVLSNSVFNSQIYKKNDKYFFTHFNIVYETDSLFTEIKPTNMVYTSSQINHIYNNNDTLLCDGFFFRGVQYSTDMAESWHTYYPFLEEDLISIDEIYKKDNQIYLRVPYGLYSSTDYGKTFEKNIIMGAYSDLIILDDRILIYGEGGMKTSKDFGKTFTTVDNSVLQINYFFTPTVVQTKSGDLLVFSTFNGVFKSSDGAETWTKLVDSLPNDTTFISVNNFYEFNGEYYAINYYPLRLLKSVDKGVSWQKIDIELFNKVRSPYIEMIDENNIILSSDGDSLKGLWVTNDQGKTWKEVDSGLLPLSEKVLAYKIVGIFNNYVFISIAFQTREYGKGALYRATFADLGITPTSVESGTKRSYLYTFPPHPNPAKSEVKVLFYWDINLPMTAEDITIYNLDGKKINTKGNIRLEKQANNYGNIVWDCSTAEPGVYLISIKHGTEERTVKMVVE